MANNRIVAFDLRRADPADRTAGPMAMVCGLPSLVRTILVLQRRGYGGAVLITDPDAGQAWTEAVGGHDRISQPLALASAPEEAAGAALKLAPGATQALLWPGELTFGRYAPEMVEAEVTAEGGLRGSQHGPTLLPMAALERGIDGAAQGAELAEEELEPLLLRGPDDSKQAEEALLRSLRKDADGAVAQYDRYISLFFSRRLMKLNVSPNWVTAGAALLGLACGLVAAHGGYWWLLAGALGFQLNSIMDGIDGEIARAKLLESPLGQWLDTLADDSCNLFFTVGAAVGCYHTWGSEYYLWLAGIIGIGFIFTAILEYHYLITVVHSGDLNEFRMPWEEGDDGEAAEAAEPGPVARLLARLKFVVRRDTFVFLSTLFALIGQLRVMVWFFALGASIVWIAILVYRVILPRNKGAAAS